MNKTGKWIIGILIVAVAVLSFLIWKGTGDLDAIMRDVSKRDIQNDSLKQVIRFHDSADIVREETVRIHDSIKDRRLDSALSLLKVNKDSLKLYKRTLQNAVSDLGIQIGQLNNPDLVHMYDSVKRTLDLIYSVGGAYINNSDSTIQMLINELSYKDSLRLVMLTEITDLKKALTACTLNFDGLKLDTDKLATKVKKQGIISKIEIGLGIIAGFFLGHSIK